MGAHAAGLLLAGFAALTPALSHMLLKGGADKLARRAVTGLVCGAGALPVAVVLPLPTGELWPWLIASAALHTVYQLVLSKGNFHGPYPDRRSALLCASERPAAGGRARRDRGGGA